MAVKLMLALNWLAMVLGAPAALQPEHLPPSVAVQRVSEQKIGSECITNSDCKEPKPFCQTKGINKCTDGMKGAKCAVDEECGQGWSCNYIGVNECRPNGLLHDGARCSVDAECSKDPVYLICNTVGVNACRARGEANDRCLDDAECQYGLVCNTVGINRCMKPRTTDEDGAEARCYRDEECEKPYICNKVGIESCRKPAGPGGSCRRDEECAPPTLCNTIGINECRVPDDGRCTRDEECEPGRVCNTHNINRCKKPASKGEHCGRDSECADGLKCESIISGGVCKKPEDVNTRHSSCDEDKDCQGRLVEGNHARPGKLCADDTQLMLGGINGTWVDLGPDGANPKCTCMKVGINSCEPLRDADERCDDSKECASGVCNTQMSNRCQNSAETLNDGERCFADAMCKGYHNLSMVCNTVGVNACRKRGEEGDHCRRSNECAADLKCSSSTIGKWSEQVGIMIAVVVASFATAGTLDWMLAVEPALMTDIGAAAGERAAWLALEGVELEFDADAADALSLFARESESLPKVYDGIVKEWANEMVEGAVEEILEEQEMWIRNLADKMDLSGIDLFDLQTVKDIANGAHEGLIAEFEKAMEEGASQMMEEIGGAEGTESTETFEGAEGTEGAEEHPRPEPRPQESRGWLSERALDWKSFLRKQKLFLDKQVFLMSQGRLPTGLVWLAALRWGGEITAKELTADGLIRIYMSQGLDVMTKKYSSQAEAANAKYEQENAEHSMGYCRKLDWKEGPERDMPVAPGSETPEEKTETSVYQKNVYKKKEPSAVYTTSETAAKTELSKKELSKKLLMPSPGNLRRLAKKLFEFAYAKVGRPVAAKIKHNMHIYMKGLAKHYKEAN